MSPPGPDALRPAAGTGETGAAANTTHAARRALLADQLRNARRTGGTPGAGRIGLAKDTSNLFRDPPQGERQKLDLRGFNHVLAVDAGAGWVEAEGMTTFEDLVEATLAHHALPAVVPELKTITLGGAAAGVGIEASSFRYGLVHETLLEFDVLTGGGKIVTCRPDSEYADLFFGFPNSYGTLGYALRLKARAVAAKPFVALSHRRFDDGNGFFAALAAQFRDGEAMTGPDFVEGVAFGPGDFVLSTGRFVDAVPYTSDYSYERIYYRSLRERSEDYLSARDFIWRWDTDWFWCSKNLGAQNPLIRRIYGRDRLGSRTYQRVMRWNARWGFTAALDRLRRVHSESVIQDVDIPLENAAAFLDFFQREVGIAPVWICPLVGSAQANRFPLYRLKPGRRYINFGFWDTVRRPQRYEPHRFNRMVEDKVVALGGIKSLYSESYFDRATFDRLYGSEAYRALKARYDPDGDFPDLYDKVVLRR